MTDVGTTSADLRAQIDPQGSRRPTSSNTPPTPSTAPKASPAPPKFRRPASASPAAPCSSTPAASNRKPPTASASSPPTAKASTAGAIRQFTTREAAPVFALPDDRGWEMVSPVDKNGGGDPGFGQTYGGGVLQAAAQGGASPTPRPPPSRTRRVRPGAASTSRDGQPGLEHREHHPAGALGHLPRIAGRAAFPTSSSPPTSQRPAQQRPPLPRLRSSHCPVENPPLAGSDAPAGYRNYYCATTRTGPSRRLLTSADLAPSRSAPKTSNWPSPAPPRTSPTSSSRPARRSPPTPPKSPAAKANAPRPNRTSTMKSGSGAPELINLLPARPPVRRAPPRRPEPRDLQPTAPASTGPMGRTSTCAKAPRPNRSTKPRGGGTFQTASRRRLRRLLHQRQATSGATSPRPNAATDLTPGGGVPGVLGASDDGTYVYYVDCRAGLFLRRDGAVTPIAPQAAADSYPPTTGTARVSADGRHLLFVSTAELTDATTTGTSKPASRDPRSTSSPPPAAASRHVCVSCNPSGERPIGARQPARRQPQRRGRHCA